MGGGAGEEGVRQSEILNPVSYRLKEGAGKSLECSAQSGKERIGLARVGREDSNVPKQLCWSWGPHEDSRPGTEDAGTQDGGSCLCLRGLL